MAVFRKAAVFGRRSTPMVDLLKQVIDILKSENMSYMLEESTAKQMPGETGYDMPTLGRECDVIIVVGGDGTTLGIARDMLGYHLPMIAINGGHLGFITAMGRNEIAVKLPAMLNGQYRSESRAMLMARLYRNRLCVFENTAVNDAGITHGIAGSMVEYSISVDNHPMAVQKADGIIVASATGSTAYSMACGGPIMHPKMQGMTVVSIAPHTLTNRPIVIPRDSVVQIRLINAREAEAYCDMQVFTPMQKGDVLSVSSINHAFTLLEPLDHNHYEVLRRKFYWNTMPNEDSGA